MGLLFATYLQMPRSAYTVAGLALALWCLAGAGDARALAFVSQSVSASAGVVGGSTGGILSDSDQDPSNVSVAVRDGSLTTPFEARAAGRASVADSTEHAANFFVEDRQFGFIDGIFHGGATVHKVQQVDEGRRVKLFVDFTLPPGFLELADNMETGPLTGNKLLSLEADLTLCDAEDCSGREVEVFSFAASLIADYDDVFLGEFLVSSIDPSLDLSHFDDDSVDVDDQGFIRVYTLDYDTFQGRAFGGVWDPGDTIYLSYALEASVLGEFAGSRALGAINDPFTLDTDPVTAFANVSLEAEPLPEPGAAFLLAAAGLLLAAQRSR